MTTPEDKTRRPSAHALHEDHRLRMRRRVEKYGLDSLAEHEVLEYLLYYAIPRRDTNPVAHALLTRFGSLAGVLSASAAELQEVSGIGPSAAAYLCMLPQIERCRVLSSTRKTERLDTPEKLAGVLAPQFRGEKQEKLALLALDDRQRLLRLVWLESGTVGSVEISVKRIAAEAIAAGASCAVLAHNHPGGAAMPSRADLLSTGEVMRALAVLDVCLTDHLIFAGEDWLSLRASGRMPVIDAISGRIRYAE